MKNAVASFVINYEKKKKGVRGELSFSLSKIYAFFASKFSHQELKRPQQDLGSHDRN